MTDNPPHDSTAAKNEESGNPIGLIPALELRMVVRVDAIHRKAPLVIVDLSLLRRGLGAQRFQIGKQEPNANVVEAERQEHERTEPYSDQSGANPATRDMETLDATDRDALPPNAQAYLRRIEEIVEVPVEIVSVGPERSQTLLSI